MALDFIRSCEALEVLGRRASGIASPEAGHAIEEILRRLRTQPFRVLVIGEFSRGKSTFLNALVGEKALPTSVRPTTAVISVIRSGVERSAVIRWRDASRAPLTLELPVGGAAKALDAVVTAKNEGSQDIEKVEITLPLPGMTVPLELIDTPGVNDMDAQREEVTYGYLARADAALMLLDLQQPLSASEKRFLEERVFANDIRKLLFVLNKIDQEPAEKRDRAIASIRKRLDEMPGCAGAPILPVAAKLALQARQSGDAAELAASLFPSFEQQLLRFLSDASGAARIRTAAGRVLRITDDTLAGDAQFLASLDGSDAEVARQYDVARRAYEQETARVGALQGELEISLERFVQNAERGIRAGIADLRRQAAAVTSRATFPSERDAAELRDTLGAGLREIVRGPSDGARATADSIAKRFGTATARSANEIQVASREFEFAVKAGRAEQETASNIGAAIGGLIGGALLGPLGGIPLAILGSWLGNSISAPPAGPSIRQSLEAHLAYIEREARSVLDNARDELRDELLDLVMTPAEESQRARYRALMEIHGALERSATDRRQRAQEVRARVLSLRGVSEEMKLFMEGL